MAKNNGKKQWQKTITMLITITMSITMSMAKINDKKQLQCQ